MDHPAYTRERWLTGIGGSVLFLFIGWAMHVPLAVWCAAILLIRSFRLADRVVQTLPLIAAMVIFRFSSITGGWEMPFYSEILFSVLVLLPMWTGLYVDRWYARRNSGRTASWGRFLAFPIVYTLGHYALGFSPVGTVFSPAAGQFPFGALAQTLSLTGLPGLTFLIGVTATTVNYAWEMRFDLRAAVRPVGALAAVFLVLLTFGYAKLLSTEPGARTVKVAGVAEAHPRDYWAITDAGTPRESKEMYAPEMEKIRESLFEKSRQAAGAGAKFIVWAEGNGVMYEDDEPGFLARAGSFAQENGIYLAASVLVLNYGETKNDNLVYLFDPDGNQRFRYEKTISWYPTDSDGILPTVETEWGRISTVICFDLDFPRLLRQAAKNSIDILLVPGYDTQHISPYHTQIGALRGVEYGFSVFRHALKSTSMAFDYNGQVLARQNYFTSADRIMYADLPTDGIRTLYGAIGEWFILLVGAGALIGLALTLLRRSG